MKECLKLICFYLCNVLVLALLWSILEIWLERFKSGWGGEFYSPFWGRKIRNNLILSYITVYHLVAISVLVAILVCEFFVLRRVAGSGFWVLNVHGIRIVPIIFLLTVLVGVMTTEDFLWFALNWHFPDALQKLLQGDVCWHVGWVSLTDSIKLPLKYFQGLVAVIILLIVQSILVHLV